MSWRVTLECTKAEAEAIPDSDDLFPEMESPPVIVADEPDPDKPDDWRLHVYFDQQPGWEEMQAIEKLAADSDPVLERLEDAAELEVGSDGGRLELVHVHAGAEVEDAHSARRGRIVGGARPLRQRSPFQSGSCRPS